MRKYTIRDPIFGATILLLIGTAEEYNRFLKRRHPKVAHKDLAAPDDDALYESRATPDGKDRFIWLPEWKDDNVHMATLTHEVDHAREEVLKYVGLRRTKASEEAYTYYSAWLLGQCLKRLRRNK